MYSTDECIESCGFLNHRCWFGQKKCEPLQKNEFLREMNKVIKKEQCLRIRCMPDKLPPDVEDAEVKDFIPEGCDPFLNDDGKWEMDAMCQRSLDYDENGKFKHPSNFYQGEKRHTVSRFRTTEGMERRWLKEGSSVVRCSPFNAKTLDRDLGEHFCETTPCIVTSETTNPKLKLEELCNYKTTLSTDEHKMFCNPASWDVWLQELPKFKEGECQYKA